MQVSEFFEPMHGNVTTDSSVPIHDSVETFPKAPIFPVPNSMCPGWLLRVT